MSIDVTKERIQRARDVALDVLKPSESDLEHGLELHGNSIVIESYGLGLHAAVDGDVLKAAVEEGASEAEIQDMTEDMHITRCLSDEREREEYRAAWEASGVTCIVQNAGTWGNDPLLLLKRLARQTSVVDGMRDLLVRATEPGDILSAKELHKHCLYLMCCGVPLPHKWVSVEEELRLIGIFFQLGARMMHLTYNRRNPIGDGCAEATDAGLSDFGRAVVLEMNRVGVIVDVAHSGWQTCLDAAEVSDRPIVSSHSGVWALNPHCRCKTDEVMRDIAEGGGLIGITNIPAFLGGSGDLSAMLDHIDYVSKNFGVETLTIGTDRSYVSSQEAIERKKIPPRNRTRRDFNWFWPPDDPLSAPEWNQERQVLSMAWTNWPLFTVGLVQRGYSDDDIQKIVGGNFLRVAREVLSKA